MHAAKYAGIPEAELIGVVDTDGGRCRETAGRHGCREFDRLGALLEEVEAVSIAVPTSCHHAIADECLRAGVDVLLEKPMTTTVDEAGELISVARQHERVLQIGHLERFNGALQAASDRIRNPRHLNAQRLSPFTGRGTDVDVVLDLMIHDIDIILSLVAGDLLELEAVGGCVVSDKLDVADAHMRFTNGCTAHVAASRIDTTRTRKMTVLDDNAHLVVDYLNHVLRVTERDVQGNELVSEVAHKNDALETELRSFLDSVRTRQQPVVSGEDGRRALEVALQIVERITQSGKR
jgi:predicted dehydrogenase